MARALLIALLLVGGLSCKDHGPNPPATPEAPQLALPADGAVDQSTSPALKWNAIDGVESYSLQISTSNSFDSLVQDHAGLTSTSLQITGLSNNTKHSWRVNAKTGFGTSKWSGIWSFTTERQIIYGRYSGFLFGIMAGDTMIARLAKITVDGSRECHADSNGRFLIDSVVEGSHLLSITHDDFFPYDTTADTRDSTQIVVKLNSRFRDCLPLNIGNQWTYSYKFREVGASSFNNVDATFTWEVISLLEEGLEIKYKVTEVCDSMHTQSTGLPPYLIDTTYGQSSGSFYFVEASDHRITIASVDGIVHVKNLPWELSMQAFYRYSRPDPYTGNVKVFQGSARYSYTCVAKADTGIVTHNFTPALGINYTNYWVSLTSCNLQALTTAGH